MLILNKHENQLGKNNALHHVESNAIGSDEYGTKYPVCLPNTSIKCMTIVITHLANSTL